jgi:hypothetical protein
MTKRELGDALIVWLNQKANPVDYDCPHCFSQINPKFQGEAAHQKSCTLAPLIAGVRALFPVTIK